MTHEAEEPILNQALTNYARCHAETECEVWSRWRRDAVEMTLVLPGQPLVHATVPYAAIVNADSPLEPECTAVEHMIREALRRHA